MEFILNAKSRHNLGKGASRRLRREGLVPAVVYGDNEPAKSITLGQAELAKVMKSRAFYSTILNLKVDNEDQEVIVRDIQRHPFKELIVHMDFLRITRGQTMQFTVPFSFINEETSDGVKLDGGEIHHMLTEILIECRPSKLPEAIEIDMQSVRLDENIHLSEITLPEGVEIVAFQQGEIEDHDEVVAAVKPVFENEVEDEAPEAPEDPEVTGESEDDDEDSSESGSESESEEK